MTISRKTYDSPTFVYQAVSDSGDVLYVGVAINIQRRLKQHDYESRQGWKHDWVNEWATLKTSMHNDRRSALKEEAALIKALSPKHNRVGR